MKGSANNPSPYDRYLAEQLKNPEFREGYERERRQLGTFDDIVNTLDRLRVEGGLSKAALARAIEKNDASIRRFFTAPRNPELRTVIALADALGADVRIVPRAATD